MYGLGLDHDWNRRTKDIFGQKRTFYWLLGNVKEWLLMFLH